MMERIAWYYHELVEWTNQQGPVDPPRDLIQCWEEAWWNHGRCMQNMECLVICTRSVLSHQKNATDLSCYRERVCLLDFQKLDLGKSKKNVPEWYSLRIARRADVSSVTPKDNGKRVDSFLSCGGTESSLVMEQKVERLQWSSEKFDEGFGVWNATFIHFGNVAYCKGSISVMQK